MGTRKVKNAVDLETGEKIYLRGHAQATFMSDGRTVEDAINGSSGGGSNIYNDLGLTKDRFSELLERDFYCPVLSDEPTASTLTYIDTDGSVNNFAIGQECRVPDVESQDYHIYKFMGIYQDNAVWQKIPKKFSDLANDVGFYAGANIKAVESTKVLDQPEVIYLTTKPQVFTEEEKTTVKNNLGISVEDMDLSAYATKQDISQFITEDSLSGLVSKDELEDYATKQDISQFITEDSLSGLASKDDLTGFIKEDALSGFATKSELEGYATDQELANYATKEEVEGFVTGEELTNYAKKSDLLGFATKEELVNSTGATPMIDHGTNDSVYALTPNVYHKWGEMSSLELTLAAPADPNIYNEYMFEFRSGDTATTLVLPDSVDWISVPSIAPNTVSQCSIVNNVGIIVTVNA